MSTRVKTLRGRRPTDRSSAASSCEESSTRHVGRRTRQRFRFSVFRFRALPQATAVGQSPWGARRPVRTAAALPSPRSPCGARRPVRTPPLSRSRPRAAATAASAPDGARADAPPRGPDYQGRRRGSSLEETRAFNDARRATRAEPSRNLPDMVIVFRRSANRS